jgi:hypothetical protein
MSDITTATWKTVHDGEPVELPATIDGIRAALPEDRREEFLDEVYAAPASELHLLLGHWALETRPDIRSSDEAFMDRLAAGDFTGCVPLDDTEADAA